MDFVVIKLWVYEKFNLIFLCVFGNCRIYFELNDFVESFCDNWSILYICFELIFVKKYKCKMIIDLFLNNF